MHKSNLLNRPYAECYAFPRAAVLQCASTPEIYEHGEDLRSDILAIVSVEEKKVAEKA